MNGNLGKIYKAITEVKVELATISTRQEERHIENQKKLERLDNLPCKVHVERMKSFKLAIGCLYAMICAVFAWIGVTHFTK